MNAVIYARYSSHNQTEQSIEGQLRDCYAYAKRCDLTVVGEYIDRAISGTTDERPDFQRMIADAPKKQFQRILVWKLDRFARSRYDSAIYKHQLKQYGVRVLSVMENVGEGDESILLEALLEASAEYYSLDLKKKIQRGQRETIAKGRFCGGSVPYGYQSVDGKLVIDEKTAPHIRYVFEQYASGVPMKKIIDELTRRGVKTARGLPLTCNTFSRALVNSAYIGQYRYKGEVVPGLCERMIDDDTSEKVQKFVTVHKHAPAANRSENVEYLLQGKAFCGHCGAPMRGECGRGKNQRTYYYYNCANRKRYNSCPKSLEKKEFLERFAVEQTVRYVLTPERIKQVAQIIVAQYEKEFSGNKISELEKRIRQLENDLNKLVDSLIEAPKVAHKRIYEKMEALEVQKAECETDLTKLRIAHDIRFTEQEVAAWLKQFCSGDPSAPEFQHKIIDTFINSIYVYDDHIIIFYNIKGEKSQVALPDIPEEIDSALSPESSTLTAVAPPNPRNPNLIPIGDGFGFLLFISSIVV